MPHSFIPTKPKSLKVAQLTENDLFPIILKYLYVRGNQTGRDIANQIRFPYVLVEPLLTELRNRMLIAYRGAAVGGDYEYELTPTGLERARQFYNTCTYCGSAPVSLDQYVESVYAQTLKNSKPKLGEVGEALKDLMINQSLLLRVGQAIRSGKSMLLYGAPGNGKTSIARRILLAIDANIWIPRTITISGEIIRVYDASLHEIDPLPQNEGILSDEIDHRWVRIKRPTIVVGGELSMEHLEATLNPNTGIIEAPIHVKSNCGCLVVDDFGRQRIDAEDLLNRWIIPLESGHDYLSLPTGRQITVPFEQLLTFSTNLSPNDICDEAFMRRIHYKIEVHDPTREQFKQLWNQKAVEMGFEPSEEAYDYLVEKHYKLAGRPHRFCHVQDLLGQIRDFCEIQEIPKTISPETIEVAMSNYFANG
jgi:predicted ATPase with chaperone activity